MTRKAVMNQIRIVLQGLKDKRSYRNIGHEANISRGTVCNIASKVAENGLGIDALLEMGDEEIHAIIYPSPPKQRWEPDWNAIFQQKKTIRRATLQQFYERYCREVPTGIPAYSYPSFCRLFSEWGRKNSHVAPQANVPHEPGEKMEIDYSGDTFNWIDAHSVRHTAHIFVAVWPYSSLVFAYATEDEKQHSWIEGCVHALEYSNGSTRLLIVDNAKALVKHADWHEGTIQIALQDLCEHYGMEATACKPRRPKEKNRVEAGVGDVQRWILADFELDGRKYYNDIDDLNKALRQACDCVNKKCFSDGSQDSRRSLFEREELPLLRELPPNRYESVDWRILVADKSHCIKLASDGGHRYTVPSEYFKQRVIVRLSKTEVRLFDPNTLKPLGTHERFYGITGQKTHLLPEHLTDIEKASRRTEQDYIKLFVSAGIAKDVAAKFVMEVFAKSDFLGRKRCGAILSLTKKTKPSILTKCLSKALEVGNTSFRFIKRLVEQEEELAKHQGELPFVFGDANYITVAHGNIRNNYV